MNRLRELRKKRGLTLKQVADSIGVSEATVQRYESGKINTLKYEIAEALAALYNVSPGYLMGWESYSSYIDSAPNWSERNIDWWKTMQNVEIVTPTAASEDSVIDTSEITTIYTSLDHTGQEQLVNYGRFLLTQREK